MNKKALLLVLFLIIVLCCAGILAVYYSKENSNLKSISYGELIGELSKNGLDVDDKIQPIDSIDFSLFSTKPKTVSVYLDNKKEELLVYIFESKRITDSEAKKVSSRGNNVGKFYLEGQHHFYRSGNLIVLYSGDNKVILDGLKKTMGRAIY